MLIQQNQREIEIKVQIKWNLVMNSDNFILLFQSPIENKHITFAEHSSLGPISFLTTLQLSNNKNFKETLQLPPSQPRHFPSFVSIPKQMNLL
jgi:hypothetical protein